MSAGLIIIASAVFFGVDAFCYWIAIRLRGRRLNNNYPGSGYVELVRALRAKDKL